MLPPTIPVSGVRRIFAEHGCVFRGKLPGGTQCIAEVLVGMRGQTFLQLPGLSADGQHLRFDADIASDTRNLFPLTQTLLDACGTAVHFLRDPTRGGVATVLNEAAISSAFGIHLHEKALPFDDAIEGACEIIGLDPLYVANEGLLLAVVAESAAEKALQALQSHPDGTHAAIIGTVVTEHPGMVTLESRIGGSRVVSMLPGEQLPRIC